MRIAAMNTIALAYAGTNDNAAIRRYTFLHEYISEYTCVTKCWFCCFGAHFVLSYPFLVTSCNADSCVSQLDDSCQVAACWSE